MKIKRLKIVNTKKWGIEPWAGATFRLGGDVYTCHFILGHYALIEFDHTMEWEW